MRLAARLLLGHGSARDYRLCMVSYHRLRTSRTRTPGTPTQAYLELSGNASMFIDQVIMIMIAQYVTCFLLDS